MAKDQYSVLGKAPSSDDLKKLSAGYGKMESKGNRDQSSSNST